MIREYKAFISYRHTPLDMKVAKAVHTLVEQYRIPKGLRKDGKNRLGLVFRDQEELPVSSNLSDDICNALDHAEFLIVICTPNTPKSIWVQREIEYFLSKHPRERILAVLAEGEPNEAFPEQLRYSIDPETGEKKDVEPLACDCRGKNDREVLANIKKESPRLFAAMLGCPYDSLVMREQKRKRKRFLISASVILAVILSFTALAVANNIKLNLKNTELEAQRLEILKRESEMLTVNAEDALENGDYLGAMRHSLNALPHGENADRPYIAGAEAALIESLNIFGERNEDFWMVDTELSRESAILAYDASPDGSRMVTVGMYGQVVVFDTKTGECLYTLDTDHSFSKSNKPLFTDDNTFIIHSHIGGISAHNLDTGSVLWTYYSQFTTYSDGMLLSDDRSQVVFVADEVEVGDNITVTNTSLIKLSAKDGSVISSIELAGRDISLVSNLPDGDYFGGNTPWGDLNDDASRMAGVYVTFDNEYKYTCYYYIADFEKESIEIIHNGEKGDMFDIPHSPIAICYDDKAGLVKAVCNSLEEKIAITFICIDTASGELKWETPSEAVDDEYVVFGSERRAFFYENELTVSADNSIYLFDAQTGEYKAKGNYEEDVTALSPLVHEEYIFHQFVTADGVYAYGWYNGTQLVSSAFATNYGELRENVSSAVIINNGSFLPIVNDGKVSGQSAGSEEQGLGYVAVIPEENQRSVKVFRALPLTVDSPEIVLDNAKYINDSFFEYGDGLIAVGPITPEKEEEKKYYAVIDTKEHKVVGSFDHYEDKLEEDMYFLDDYIFYIPDYKSFIACNPLGEVLLYDGSKLHTLVKDESVNLALIDDIQYIASRSYNSSAVLSESNNVITASVDTEDKILKLWENGKELRNVSLEDNNVNFFYQYPGSRRNLLCAGRNGYIVMSHYAETAESDTLASFAIYDINNNSFSFINDEAKGEATRKVLISDTKPTFAVADADNTVRIYNIQTRTLSAVLDLPVPVDAIQYMEYKDEFIAIVTGDSQLFIYTDDGKNVYRDNVELFTDIDIFTDNTNNRLYVGSRGNVICFERDTWQIIATLRDFIAYIPESNEIYTDNILNSNIRLYSLPSTEALIEKAQALDG